MLARLYCVNIRVYLFDVGVRASLLECSLRERVQFTHLGTSGPPYCKQSVLFETLHRNLYLDRKL